MRKRIVVLLFLAVFLSVPTAFAGVLKGVVSDSSNGGPLGGVVIGIASLGIGTQSDFDGNYELANIPEGKYEVAFNYVTYSKVVKTITIKKDETIGLNVTLNPEKSQLREVIVKSNKITNTETAVMLEIKKSNLIVSGVGATQIAKTMDRNAADVVKRIPGVSILEDRFIMVRGLYDRYNTTWLNDAGAPSAEVDKKSFSFDIVPSGQIDRILVFKTPAPELPGDFAGGMVKIYTSSLPDKNQISVGLQTSYRENSTGTDFNYNPRGKTDWLGYDDGHRTFPEGLPAKEDFNKAENAGAVTKAFDNNWKIFQKKQPLDARFNLSVANVIKGNKLKFGNLFGLTYSNVSTNYEVVRHDFEQADTATRKPFYNDQESANKASVSLMENAAVSFGRNKIELKNIYNQTGRSQTVIRKSIFDPNYAEAQELNYIMDYQSVATYSGQLMGSHTSASDNRRYNWALGYTNLFKNQPDYMRIKYTMGPDSIYRAATASFADVINGGGKFYSKLNENIYSFSHNFYQKFNIGNYAFELNAGNYVEYKERDFNARSLGFYMRFSPGVNMDSLQQLPVGEIFDQNNVGMVGHPTLEDKTTPLDSYTGKNKLIASYISLTLPIGDKFRAVGGVRYEMNTQSLDYRSDDTVSFTEEKQTNFLLPSVNLTYNFNDKSLLRAAYGKTINRPEFREIAPFYFYDNENNAGIYGSLYPSLFNPSGSFLNVAEIQNFDLRYEFYPSNGEVVQLGGFYKSFKNPIQRVLIPGGDVKDFTFVNGKSAEVYGMEIDLRKNLGFVDEWLSTKFLKDFTVVGNLSLIKSTLRFDSSSFGGLDYTHEPDTRLQGQSPYVVNLGLYYQNEDNGFKGSLLYNVFGPRIYAIGIGKVAPLYESPFHSLDFLVEKTFLKHYAINIGVQNLLDGVVRLSYDFDRDDKIADWESKFAWKEYTPGRYFTFGVKVKF